MTWGGSDFRSGLLVGGRRVRPYYQSGVEPDSADWAERIILRRFPRTKRANSLVAKVVGDGDLCSWAE